MDTNEDNKPLPPIKIISGVSISTLCALGLSMLPWIAIFWGAKTKNYYLLLHFDFHGWIWLLATLCICVFALNWAIYKKRNGWIIGNIYVLVFNCFFGFAVPRLAENFCTSIINVKSSPVYVFRTMIYTLRMDQEGWWILGYWSWAFACVLGLVILTKAIFWKTKKHVMKELAVLLSIGLIIIAWPWFYLMCIFEMHW